MVADALEMLGEVWTVRRARTSYAHGKVDHAPMIPPFEAAVSTADPPLGPVSTLAGVRLPAGLRPTTCGWLPDATYPKTNGGRRRATRTTGGRDHAAAEPGSRPVALPVPGGAPRRRSVPGGAGAARQGSQPPPAVPSPPRPATATAAGPTPRPAAPGPWPPGVASTPTVRAGRLPPAAGRPDFGLVPGGRPGCGRRTSRRSARTAGPHRCRRAPGPAGPSARRLRLPRARPR
jgi:hypothetical protein